MAKIRVLYIHQDGLVTGSAISLMYFLSAINREVYEPIVLLAEEGPARGLYEDLGIEVHMYKFHTFWTCPGPRWYSHLNIKQCKALWANNNLCNFVKKLYPDIIHINDKAALNAGISLKSLGKPIVLHNRSTYNLVATKFNKWLSTTFIKKFCDRIISISEDELDGFTNFGKFSIINNTVDKGKIEDALNQKKTRKDKIGIKEDEVVVGLVGLVSAFKGAWYFLDMAKELIKKFPQLSIKFLIVGKVPDSNRTLLNDGKYFEIPTKEYLENFISENGLREKIIIYGFSNEVLDLYAVMDILVAINNFGAMGRQPIEAQALGIPVVVTHGQSGKSKIVINGEGGIVINNPVNINELVAGVESLILNPVLRKTMGEKGRAHAMKNFDPETNMRKIEAIYQELLSKK